MLSSAVQAVQAVQGEGWFADESKKNIHFTVVYKSMYSTRDASDEMTELRHKERKWSRVQWRQLCERESETRRRICGIPTSKILRHESYF